MNNPLFSVEVLTYNQEEYIAQTLDSILLQEHNYPYEIIIGDDYSTDGTRKILLDYKKKYPDIIVLLLNEQNMGIIGNYFNVLSNARGKYIMECGGDDYWLPGKVAMQIEFMEKNPETGMCYGKAKQYVENYKKMVKKLYGKDTRSFEEMLMAQANIAALTTCFRRDLLLQYIAEINPAEKSWIMEDHPMWLWFAHNSKIHFFDMPLGVYRVLVESACHSQSIEKRMKSFYSLMDVKLFFLEKYHIDAEPVKTHFEEIRIRAYIAYALKTGNFVLYREYIKKLPILNAKDRIKNFSAGSKWIFSIFRLTFILRDYLFEIV
jgi:glycosyltransferase involved in cell wall biosynthesis